LHAVRVAHASPASPPLLAPGLEEPLLLLLLVDASNGNEKPLELPLELRLPLELEPLPVTVASRKGKDGRPLDPPLELEPLDPLPLLLAPGVEASPSPPSSMAGTSGNATRAEHAEAASGATIVRSMTERFMASELLPHGQPTTPGAHERND